LVETVVLGTPEEGQYISGHFLLSHFSLQPYPFLCTVVVRAIREVLSTEGIPDDAEQSVNDPTLNFLVSN
jgi:hypothetical protein